MKTDEFENWKRDKNPYSKYQIVANRYEGTESFGSFVWCEFGSYTYAKETCDLLNKSEHSTLFHFGINAIPNNDDDRYKAWNEGADHLYKEIYCKKAKENTESLDNFMRFVANRVIKYSYDCTHIYDVVSQVLNDCENKFTISVQEIDNGEVDN